MGRKKVCVNAKHSGILYPFTQKDFPPGSSGARMAVLAWLRDSTGAIAGAIVASALGGAAALVGWAFSVEYRIRANRTAIAEGRREQHERDQRNYAELVYIRERVDDLASRKR